jgi:hypothetical protein
MRLLVAMLALLLLAAPGLRAQQVFLEGAGTENRQWLPERVKVLNPAQRYPSRFRMT